MCQSAALAYFLYSSTFILTYAVLHTGYGPRFLARELFHMGTQFSVQARGPESQSGAGVQLATHFGQSCHFRHGGTPYCKTELMRRPGLAIGRRQQPQKGLFPLLPPLSGLNEQGDREPSTPCSIFAMLAGCSRART